MNKLKVPYVQSPALNACALACHLMVAQAFFPDVTMDDLKTILRWKDGYAVWAFPFWLWLCEQNVSITDYDSISYRVWANEGLDGLKRELTPSLFEYFKKNTVDPNSYQNEIKSLFHHECSFTYHQKPPCLEDLLAAIEDGAICETVVDSCALNNCEGFSLHRVIVLDVHNDEVILHDPVRPDAEPRPERRVPLDRFLKSWPSEKGGPDSAELCIYKMKG